MAKYSLFNFKNEFDVILFGFMLLIISFSFKSNSKLVAPRTVKEFVNTNSLSNINNYIADNKNTFCNIDFYQFLIQLNVNIIDHKDTSLIVEFIPVCGFYSLIEKKPKIVAGFDF